MKEFYIDKGNRYCNKYDLPIGKLIFNKSFSYKFIIEAEDCEFDATGSDIWNSLCGIGAGWKQSDNAIRAMWRFNKEKATFEWCMQREIKGNWITSDIFYGATCIVTYNKEDRSFDIQVGEDKATYNLHSESDMRILNQPIHYEVLPKYCFVGGANGTYKITRI
jgi:hypothetical protein